jgi:hypothetical protein
MFRLLATLAFAVSFDIILTGGRYIAAADQLVLTVAQHF